MNKAVMTFADNKKAKTYFKSIRVDYNLTGKYDAVLGFADIKVVDNTVVALSAYHTESSLQMMLDSKGQNY